jgi:ferredoxin
MTGAVKNHFGIIPGLTKPGYHAKLHDTARFADMLLDLSAYVAPRVSIMDAVVGMEGDGPNAGEPRHIGLLLAARNPLALDVVASEIIGLPREHNPVLVAAEKRGLSPTRLGQVELVGADAADLRIPGFRLPATFAVEEGLANLPWWQRALKPLFRDGLTIKPRVLKDKCVACGACRDACPMHVITIKQDGKKYAHIDDSACIRCYCCHEMCPQDAIELHRSLLYRIINT